jgi:uncharacterized iron-regulated membrane protein
MSTAATVVHSALTVGVYLAGGAAALMILGAAFGLQLRFPRRGGGDE